MHSLAQATSSPRKVATNARSHLLWPAGAVLLGTLWSISSQDVSPTEFFFAGALLALTIQAYISWSRARITRIPVWTLVCAAHFVFYGLAIFGALRRSPSMFDHGSDLPNSILSAAMLIGIVGLCSMGTGR